jgi:hypothetical protein
MTMTTTLYVGCVGLCMILVLSSFTAFKSNGTENATVNLDDTNLQKLMAEYVNWNANLPTEQLPEEGNHCLIKPGPVYLLLDPFSKGTVSQTCEIKLGSPLFFPFYEGWCDSGTQGVYGVKDYKKMLGCALDSDKGVVTMQAWLDGKEIVNIKVNNKDVNNSKLVYDKYPDNVYYKVIKSPSFFDVTLTNKSRFASDAYQKPEDFQSSPYTYKGVAHCFCGVLSNLTHGDHELRYKTLIEGSAGLAEGKGWDQVTDITYKLKVR